MGRNFILNQLITTAQILSPNDINSTIIQDILATFVQGNGDTSHLFFLLLLFHWLKVLRIIYWD